MPSERAIDRAYVWVWLPGAIVPVVAGVLSPVGDIVVFRYAQSYQQLDDALPLYLPELPIGNEVIRPPVGLTIAGSIADAGPDRWGQRVILRRLIGGDAPDADVLTPLTYLLESGSDRFGSIDFQDSPTDYVERRSHAPLEELLQASERVDAGEPFSQELELALFAGSSLGGARPKVALRGRGKELIAKFSSHTDPYAVVRAEGVAMNLARRVGLDVAPTSMIECLGRDVLLVERFDRTLVPGERRMTVSVLTILELDPLMGRYASYHGFADVIRQRFTNSEQTLREVFSRIVFNICVGNTDDHGRNHAALWNGSAQQLTISPAYDICPQLRSGGEASQAMAIRPGQGGNLSLLANCVEAAPIFHLSSREARVLIDHQLHVIESQWLEASEEARLTESDRQIMWHRMILNPYCLEGYQPTRG
jgi:serine/threonine-protein kinase HipA